MSACPDLGIYQKSSLGSPRTQNGHKGRRVEASGNKLPLPTLRVQRPSSPESCDICSGTHLDFDTVERLAVVDTDDRADHLGDDDHVTEVGLDTTRALKGLGLLLGLAQALDERHGLALKTTREAAAGAGVHEVHELFVVEVEELVEVDATVRELLEGALLAGRSDFDQIMFVSLHDPGMRHGYKQRLRRYHGVRLVHFGK